MPLEVVKLAIKSILRALVRIHRDGYIHRDLKTNNVLLNFDNEFKVCDFGNTIHKSEKNRETKVSHPYYTAPEMALGVSEYTNKVDMWSAGVILFEMMTQRVPFPASNHQEIL